jgi:hypothetical protein
MRRAIAALGLSAALCGLSAPADAQGVRFGAHANLGTGLRDPYLTKDGGDANRGAGVRVVWELGLEHEGLGLLGSIDVFEGKSKETFIDELTLEPFSIGGRYWEFNVGAIYARGNKRLKFYVGLGLNVANDTLDKDYITTFEDNDALDLGGNVLFGAKAFEHLFVETRAQVRGGGQFIVSVGLLL